MPQQKKRDGPRAVSGTGSSTATPSLQDDPTYSMATKLFNVLFKDALVDSVRGWTIDAKRREARSGNSVNGLCSICGQNCAPHSGSVASITHDSNGHAGPASAPGSKSGTPAPGDPGASLVIPSALGGGGSISARGTPIPGTMSAGGGVLKPDIYAANPLFECVVCSRQVSSNRYALHLAKCLGIGAKEKSSRKPGSGTGGGASSANGSDAGAGSGGSTGNSVHGGGNSSILNSTRVLTVLENRRRARAPDAELRAQRGEPAGRGKKSTTTGKRGLSPSTAVGPKWKKSKLNTPPPGSTVVREELGMARSQSLQVMSQGGTSAPVFGSPLNPNKQATSTREGTAATGGTGTQTTTERDASPAMSISTVGGDGYDTAASAVDTKPRSGSGANRKNTFGTGHGTGVGSARPSPGPQGGMAGSSPARPNGNSMRGSSVMSDESPLKGKNHKGAAAARSGGARVGAGAGPENDSDDESYHGSEASDLERVSAVESLDEEESDVSDESSLED